MHVLWMFSLWAISVVVLVLAVLVVLYYSFKLAPSERASFFRSIMIGHRGATDDRLPVVENTMDAFVFAFNHCDGIEFDLQLTRDRKVVIFHDSQNVTRVLRPLKNGNGIKSVHMLDFKTLHQYRFQRGASNQRVPLWDELVGTVVENYTSAKLMIELKEWRFMESVYLAFQVVETLNVYPELKKRAVVGSFNPVNLYLIRTLDPTIVTNQLFYKNIFRHFTQESYDWPHLPFFENFRSGKFPKWNFFAKKVLIPIFDVIYTYFFWTIMPSFLGVGVVGSHVTMATDERVKKMKDRGYEYFCWGVNSDEDKKRLMKKNVACCSDYNFDGVIEKMKKSQ